MQSKTNYLTGNVDTDVTIINSLNLDDLRNICRMNQYAANLCENHITLKSRIKLVKHKVSHLMDLINTKHLGIILQPMNESEPFITYHDLMNKINITEPANEEDDTDLHPSNILNDYIIMSIRISKENNQYLLTYNLGQFLQYYDVDVTTFYANAQSLQEFLTHAYYNHLILNV